MRIKLLILALSISLAYGQKLAIDDSGWHLWPDTAAAWENDQLFLPGEVQLENMPVNPPSGGWQTLNDAEGIEIKLPATVEQYYWGAFGYRPYKNAYYFENDDDQVQNGSYRGVSWWWKDIKIPESFQNKHVSLFIRGARLRAEVYLNGQLVGYNIITETSFTCDLSEAMRPGETNRLAIRITNPGGRFDWLDTQLMAWGEYRFHASHGFGGLDRGLYLRAHDEVFIKDLWVLNRPEKRKVNVNILLDNRSNRRVNGVVELQLKEKPGNKIEQTAKAPNIKIAAGETTTTHIELGYDEAQLWELDDPNLYRVTSEFSSDADHKDRCSQVFGFRWFEADGVDDNAVLRLNGQRIRLTSAISWGYWGLNGLWPLPHLAEREVQAARAFGMNCINFHRNIGKAEVLNAQDRIGLLRFMEPGGGQTALGDKYSLYAESPQQIPDRSGKNGAPRTFTEKYMEAKILAMIRDHRSHPSLIMYNIQNEIHPNLNNPRIFNLLRKMHREDPSRIVMLKSGIPPRNQAWMQPYEDSIRVDRGDGYSGWWDQHTVGGPGVWQDAMYDHPENFTHRSENSKEIATWGEMLGAAVSDDHRRMLSEIEELGGKSYDRRDHQEIDSAYSAFLDHWDFRDAFATTSELYRDIGNKSYDFWARVVETARLAEANDFLVISGWESTAIENHSGLVDNLRGFKGDPDLLKQRLAPFRLVVKPRSLVVHQGNCDTLDLYLLNETNRPHGGNATLSLRTPAGGRKDIGNYKLPAFEKDRFVYPLAQAITTPALQSAGWYRLEMSLDGRVHSQDSILVIDPKTSFENPITVGVAAHEPAMLKSLQNFPGISAKAFETNEHYDVMLVSDRLLQGWRSEVSSDRQIADTEDDVLYHTESWGYYRNLEYKFDNLPADSARVTFYLAEVTLQEPGDRIMNVAINGRLVLEDFDIVAATGGPNIALDTSFTVAVQNGGVYITVPELTTNYAKFSAIKVVTNDTLIAINCGGPAYKDNNGLIWQPYRQEVHLKNEILAKAKAGTPLLLLPDGPEATEAYGKRLASNNLLEFKGHVGKTRASWMGSWYFIREHPVFAGLPVNQAMKSYYQVPVHRTDGLLVDGDNVEVFVGYGRDHDRNIGAASLLIDTRQSRIMIHTIPGIVSMLSGESGGMQPVMAKRLFTNSIRYLTGHQD